VAVVWWLIPFANFVKPFQSVRELWKASSGDDAWERLPTWPVIGWWWACWIASALVASAFGFFLGLSDHRDPVRIESLITSRRVGLLIDLVVIVAAILAIAIVRSVVRRQVRLAAAAVAPAVVVPPRPDPPVRWLGSGL
jgi:hypothetical protein